MNIWQFALLMGALLTLFFARNVKRADLWIFCGGASFIISAMYEAAGYPYPPFVAMICDSALVCLPVYFLAKRRWEVGFFRIFQAMVLWNLLYLSGLTVPHYWHITGLEILNWIALLLINVTAYLQRADNERTSGIPWHPAFRRASAALWKARAEDPWHKV